MSETKRATLTSISTPKSNVKKDKEVSKTIRFTLKLPESNEKACPEYNYRDLLNSAEKKNKIKEKKVPIAPNGINLLDPFDDDNDDDVKRIARQFEQKYGLSKPTGRKGKKEDYADIGAGYDESDSFIDNTDAYDEVVPGDITTLHGGFYINSGALEFKQVSGSEGSSSSEEEEEESSSKPPNRKRIIESSSDSSSEEDEKEDKDKEQNKDKEKDARPENPEKKQKIDSNGVAKPMKKRISIDDKEHISKKKKIEDPNKKKLVTVKDLLKEKREEFNITLEEKELGLDVDKPVESDKVTKSAPANDTVNDIIESVVNAGRVEPPDETSKDSSSSGDIDSSETDSSRDEIPSTKSEQKEETGNNSQEIAKLEETATKLPENLPAKVLELISELKKAAVQSTAGKVKFFSGNVNKMFLELEIQCKTLGRGQRVLIYEHLAPFVKCKKDTLMRRAKNLLLDDARSKINEPLKKLKQFVERMMPKAIKHYEKKVQEYKDELTKPVSENGESKKTKSLPKPKFPLTHECRSILSEIISIKKKCFLMEGTRKETFEEHLENFMKIGVVGFWPDGWMPIATLMTFAKYCMDNSSKAVPSPIPSKQSQPQPSLISSMQPITLDISSPSVNIPINLSPTKNMSHSPNTSMSGISVIPLPPKKTVTNTNVPKIKTSSVKSEINLNKQSEMTITPAVTEINDSASLMSSLNSVTITSVDLRTNKEPKISESTDSDCQIIDLTDTPPTKKSSPKNKPKYEITKPVKIENKEETTVIRKSEETSHSINNIIGSTKHSSEANTTKNKNISDTYTHLKSNEGHMKYSNLNEAHMKYTNEGHKFNDTHLKYSGEQHLNYNKNEAHLSDPQVNEAQNLNIRTNLNEVHRSSNHEAHKLNVRSSNEAHLPSIHTSSEAHKSSIKSTSNEAHKSSIKPTSNEPHKSSMKSISNEAHKSSIKTTSNEVHLPKVRAAHMMENLSRPHPIEAHMSSRTPNPSEAHVSTKTSNLHEAHKIKYQNLNEAHMPIARTSNQIEAHASSIKSSNNPRTSNPIDAHTSNIKASNSTRTANPIEAHTSNIKATNNARTSNPIEAHTSNIKTSSNTRTANPIEAHASNIKTSNIHESHNLKYQNLKEAHLPNVRTSNPIETHASSIKTSNVHETHNLKYEPHVPSMKYSHKNESYPIPIKSLNEAHMKYTNEAQPKYKEQQPNEDDMEQVMKDLKELQQMQEHARTSELDIMSPCSSPVSVIAYNSNFSSNKSQPTEVVPKERKVESAGFQEMYQKHLFQEPFKGQNIYSNVTSKNNFNSMNDYIARSGSISNTFNSHRYTQNTSKYNSNINNLPANPPGATNHADDFALFSNLLYQYGYHNTSGSKQKSPP